MDVQRYISSGIIENHVIGLVSEAENREMEVAIQQHPEVKAAVDAAQQDLEKYVMMMAQKPPVHLKKQILERLKQDAGAAEPAIPVTQPVAIDEEIPVIDYTPRTPISPLKIWQYGAAAAFTLLVASAVMNIAYYTKYNDSQSQYASLQSSQDSFAAEKDTLSAQLHRAQEELTLMKDPAFKWIKMLGTPRHQGNVATICWDPQSKATFILAQKLPEPPPDMQYQLWAIVNGKCIDAGVFSTGEQATSMQKVKDVVNAQAFAVTLEKKGGSPTPTLDQMFVAGKVAG
ncbi:anti-sigma factor [Chitinophaga sp.]|uniref:anti-sigma factor n=1 Tax=Chitinophaga sp. TaxID=1869181 RepID=UPI0031CE9E9E